MLGYDDKRNFYRMMINSPCLVLLIDEPSSPALNAICRDISATGMSLELGENTIEVGTLVEISIESNNEQIPSLKAKAKVLRLNEDESGAHIVGVEISEMT